MFVLGGALPEDEVHVISAIGKGRIGQIKSDTYKSLHKGGWGTPSWCVKPENIHEVVFESPKESPELKLAKCKELGIQIFFDDREDVCNLLNANGILAFIVPRKNNTSDIQGERK